ncbi:MAG: response regulator [Anaerolineae bacterium]|nr:response regulator [Anaerolineae bacterium]
MRTILVIEDTPAMREEILEMLTFEGYDAIGVPDGVSGIQTARETRPDLILCDVMMPVLDGYETLAAIRSTPSMALTPFIFLTAKSAKVDMRRGMELGADDYLTKPFTADELLAAIAARLTKHELVMKQADTRLDLLRQSIALALPHELRTPLTHLIGFSELLVEGIEQMNLDEIMESARTINHASQRLHRLTEKFMVYMNLEMRQAEAHREKLPREYEVVNVNRVIGPIAQHFAQQAKRQADLHLELEDCDLHTRLEDLERIVQELIDNALKFSRPGTPIRVGSTRDSTAVALSITNQGHGMTAEQIANIGAYIQFDRQRHEQQGVGLGLIIVQRLVSLNDGQMTITSVPDGETTVVVRMPIKPTV